jgi:type II secretory ATPase GspE/PulE/Tfp pilus assembly ATPase PilB-like protein
MENSKDNHDSSTAVTQLVERIIQRAIVQNASDIHFEPSEKMLRVRYRIDGILSDQFAVEKELTRQVISHIKVLSHINITEKRVPQDGKLHIIHNGTSIDIRVSTFPVLDGEKLVLRILDQKNSFMNLTSLGMQPAMLASFKELCARPNGFFLVTGPTGSGKTTTLYAALALLNSPEKIIITLEDPIEYTIPDITQGQINPDVGFSFEKGARAILRQDPDIVMIGEIRDPQTARSAIEAALTGHMIFSTLHTPNAVTVVMRLIDMGIEPFLLNAAMTGALAQRLARRICGECRVETEPSCQEEALMKRFNMHVTRLYKGTGCDLCFQMGYKGRIGIFELLVMSDALRTLVVQSPSLAALYAQARLDGMIPLLDDGLFKVEAGLIPFSELLRVLSVKCAEL